MYLTDFVSLLKADMDKFHTYYTEQMAINEAPAILTEDEWTTKLCEWSQVHDRNGKID